MKQRHHFNDRRSWSVDEMAVLHMNHARGDSVKDSARILQRRPRQVRQMELTRGLWRRKNDPRHKTNAPTLRQRDRVTIRSQDVLAAKRRVLERAQSALEAKEQKGLE